MASNATKNNANSLYARLSAWNSRVYARLLLWVAAGIARLAQLWQGNARSRMESVTRFLRDLAAYIVQPETIRMMASTQLLKRALLETVAFTVLLTLAVVWTLLSVYGFLIIALVPVALLVIALCLLFTHLIYLLALSSDIYQSQQDEGQRLFTYQASTTTLRIIGWLLVVLSLGLALVPGWRSWVAIDLGALVLLARMIYLARLAQLRWTAFALVPLEEEGAATLVEER